MRRLILFAAAVIALGCASAQYPPGGPERHEPAKLVSVTPDSGAVNAHPSAVVFQFDEVVSERSGSTDLNGMFIVSPRDGESRVDWHRSSITVRARHDWRPNTVYTITMLPGLADLRGNISKVRKTISFSTGPDFPTGRIAGIVYDWAAGKGIPLAFVEAVRRPDSTVFIAQTDSSGRFSIPFLTAATYVVYGYQDQNNNRARDPREMYDSTVFALVDTANLSLRTFTHDSVGPGFANLDVRDSLTLRVTFDQPVPLPIDTSLFRLTAPDSTRVPIVRAVSMTEYDKALQDSAAHADSLKRRDTLPTTQVPLPPVRGVTRDTTKRLQPAVLAGPLPITGVVLKLGSPLKAGATYRLEAIGLRNLLGKTRAALRVFVAPKPPPPRSPADSLPRRTAPRDSLGRRPPADSARRVGTPPLPPPRPPSR